MSDSSENEDDTFNPGEEEDNEVDTFNPGGEEEDDDELYYEVEEIIQMVLQDNGVPMYEIKWKNYPSS